MGKGDAQQKKIGEMRYTPEKIRSKIKEKPKIMKEFYKNERTLQMQHETSTESSKCEFRGTVQDHPDHGQTGEIRI